MEGDKPVNDGICLTCAKELGIKPVDDLLQKFGITDDDMEQMDQQLGALMNPEENGEGGEGTSCPAAPRRSLFCKTCSAARRHEGPH